MVDILIENGMIIDGSGEPGFIGTIAVENEDIVGIFSGKVYIESVKKIDAAGMWVLPGFIDIHRHGDLTPFLKTDEELRQGITTFINGNCGFSAIPSTEKYFQMLTDYSKPIIGTIPEEMNGMDQKTLFSRVQNCEMACNQGYLVGNGTLRISVKGFDASPMTRKEMDVLKEKLANSLEAGALGLSLGLMYVPENFYTFEELAEICEIPAKMKKIVTVHMRGEGRSLVQSVQEVIDLAKVCGGKFHISHLKAAGKRNWHTVIERVIGMVREARRSGVDIDFDVYPYCAGSTALYTLLPPKALEGGIDKALERLRDQNFRKKIQCELKEEQESWDNLVASTGWDRVVLVGGEKKSEIGKNIQEIGEQRGLSAEECMMDLLLENHGDAPIVFYSMCQQDVERILWSPESIVISDALYSEEGLPHPRRYGSFSHLICTYKDQIPIEKIIPKITSAPAKRMGIENRGSLKTGFKADIVIISPEKLKDMATYERPRQYPEGIEFVIVNGKIAKENDGKGASGFFGHLIV